MGSLRKWRRDFVRGLLLAAITISTLPLSAQQPPAPRPTKDLASSDNATPANEDFTSSERTLASGETDGQNTPTQPSSQSGDPAPPVTQAERTHWAVNPVTGLVPVSAFNYVPLTGKQRWKVYWKQTYFSYGAYFKPVMFALVLDQTTNSPSQWGGGFRGFGLRVASRTASGVVQSTIRAPLAAALHEDVRYVYSGQHNVGRRILYAVEYSFLTYNDRHQPTLNIAKLVGYYGSTAISTRWHPPEHSLAEYTFANGSEQLGLAVPINILQEFWPSIARAFTHHK